MTHSIIGLVCLGLLIVGTASLAGSSFSAFGLVHEAGARINSLSTERARSRLSLFGNEVGAQGPHVRVTLKNAGQTSLADFPRWDIIVQYYGTDNSYYIKRLSYSAGAPGDNQWGLTGIFQDTQTLKPDVFEPGVFNVAEQIWLHLKLNPQVGATATNWATIATPNGVTTRVIFKVLPPILYVADQADQTVYKYWSDGTFLGTGPLDSLNIDARGITTDYTNFWTEDKGDDVYQYSAGFALLTSWAQTDPNNDGDGLTTDGSNIWVVNHHDNFTVYKYTKDGTLLSSFPLTGENKHATGITTDGSNIWVADHKKIKVYKYAMDGTFVSEFSLTGSNTGAEGITTDGNNIWVVDTDDDKVYKYTMAGSFDSSFSLATANADPKGITVFPR